MHSRPSTSPAYADTVDVVVFYLFFMKSMTDYAALVAGAILTLQKV